MDNVFVLSPDATNLDIQEAIHQRLTQLRSITHCLLLANHEFGNMSCYGIIWSIDSLLGELDMLCEQVLT